METITGSFKAAEDNIVESGSYLSNLTVHTFSWQDVTVTVRDRRTKRDKEIVSGSSGIIRAGELLALMGPSGSGKTTLLNSLARRKQVGTSSVSGTILVNGLQLSLQQFQKLSCYVEQHDLLLGALTVRETLDFAARLSLPMSLRNVERAVRVNELLTNFGLCDQAETLIGTPIRKGISGGQQRRVSVASQLITSPKIVFLDEPTSGLDSAASYEVMSFIKSIAKQHNLLVIASIHQPSTKTFQLFDKLLLLSGGKTIYNGRLESISDHFDLLGQKMPRLVNPAEFVVELVNTDFQRDAESASRRLEELHASWRDSPHCEAVLRDINSTQAGPEPVTSTSSDGLRNQLLIPFTLTHRLFIKSYRDVIAYGIRIAMYMGLAVLMGTVWLRLDTTQENIQNFINAIFFGGAFMSFMAVAYIPSFLEDRSLYVKERANGLYGPTAFMVSNFIIGLPFLFIITILFSIVAFWLGNFRPTALSFWTWVMWLFLDLVAAESLVVLIAAIAPLFVVALAATSFVNGLWMAVGGFLVNPKSLNVFWRYVFHYIDYQAYVFRGMMVNEFRDRTYSCGANCQCMYVTDLAEECLIDGKGVLKAYGFGIGNTGKWVGILLAITLGYRLLGWLALYLRRT